MHADKVPHASLICLERASAVTADFCRESAKSAIEIAAGALRKAFAFAGGVGAVGAAVETVVGVALITAKTASIFCVPVTTFVVAPFITVIANTFRLAGALFRIKTAVFKSFNPFWAWSRAASKVDRS